MAGASWSQAHGQLVDTEHAAAAKHVPKRFSNRKLSCPALEAVLHHGMATWPRCCVAICCVLQDVAAACGVRSMPTFQAYFNDEKVAEFSGADPKGLENMIKR